MQVSQRTQKWALLALSAFLIVMLVFVIVHRKEPPPNAAYDTLVNEKEKLISEKQQYIEANEVAKRSLQAQIEQLQADKQTLLKALAENSKKLTQNTNDYEKIPDYVRSLTKDSLRSAIANFKD